MEPLHDCRVAYASALEGLAATDSRICVVVNDSVGSSKLEGFKASFPDRLINAGIAEQNMVGVAAGLANSGKIPYVSAASPFLTGRALEQIKVDVAYSDSNVKLCAMSPGVAYGELGPTHHSIEDLAWMRAIANMVVVVPADPLETEQAIRAAADHHGPVFLRISRMPVPTVHEDTYRFRFGKAAKLREGDDIAIISNGTMVTRAMTAAERLEEAGVQATVLNLATVRPIDTDAVIEAAHTGAIVTAEEHTVFGGLGSAVAEVVVANHPVPMRMLGIPGEFVPTGSPEWILDHYGLTSDGICNAALDLIGVRA